MSGSDSTGGGALGGAEGGASGASGAGGALPEQAGELASLVRQVVGSGMFTSPARSVGARVGREISRSLFGTARRRR